VRGTWAGEGSPQAKTLKSKGEDISSRGINTGVVGGEKKRQPRSADVVDVCDIDMRASGGGK